MRKERLQEIARMILSQLNIHGEISLLKTVATLQYEFGLTREKILEYLHVLEDLGRFALDDEHDKITKISVS